MEQAQLMVVWAQVQAHLCLNFGKPLMELNHLWLLFRHGAAHGYPFYNTPTVHINNFWDFARGSNEYDRNSYFNRNGASSTARYYGDENFAFLNGEKPEQGQGLDSIYSFIGKGT